MCGKVAKKEWSLKIRDRRTQFIVRIFSGQKHFHVLGNLVHELKWVLPNIDQTRNIKFKIPNFFVLTDFLHSVLISHHQDLIQWFY